MQRAEPAGSTRVIESSIYLLTVKTSTAHE